MLVRLQKHIADLGLASRRQAEKLIAEGRVKVNGVVVTELGVKVDPEQDTVNVHIPKEKKPPILPIPFLKKKEKKTAQHDYFYIMLNKPVDISTDPKGKHHAGTLLTRERNIGRSFVPDDVRVFSIDQLPKDVEGLTLFTNDKHLLSIAPDLLSRYLIATNAPLSRAARDILEKGIMANGELIAGVYIVKEFNKGRQTLITVQTVGTHDKLRTLFETIGYPVTTIRRVQVAKCSLGTLSPGRWRRIRKERIMQ